MKQQCHISSIYLSWGMVVAGLIFLVVSGSYVQAAVWVIAVPFFLWLYVRFFPSVSRFMGYGSVEDQPANETKPVTVRVTLYTGVGCPFCPLVKKRLVELQTPMGFELTDVDVTLKPDLLLSNGIRALPVVEIGDARLTGNAASKQLATFIADHSAPTFPSAPHSAA